MKQPRRCESLTFDGEVAGALGMLSSLIGQVDAVVGFVSLLGVSDPQGEDVVSLDHHVLAALKHSLLVLQPFGLCSLCVHLAVQDDFLTFFGLRVLQWRDDLQFLCRKKTSETLINISEPQFVREKLYSSYQLEATFLQIIFLFLVIKLMFKAVKVSC